MAEGRPRVSPEVRKIEIKPGHVPEERRRVQERTGSSVRGLLSPLPRVYDGATI